MSDTDLTIERVFDAPRDRVWRAWTDAAHLRQWWAPRPWETVDAVVEPRPGGRFFTHMRGPEGEDAPNEGCFLDAVANKRLVWTSALRGGWRPNASGPEGCGGIVFTAIMTLSDAGAGRTRYHVVVMHPDAASARLHAEMGFHEGWGTCADQLGAVAAALA